jgi:hypothetical protein
MIKFFRKIRQNLLMENKTGKYLKYAIGEIILVVIGILIALQINNWNENNKLETKKQDYYQQLLEDLKKDKEFSKMTIELFNKRREEYENYKNEFYSNELAPKEVYDKLLSLNNHSEAMIFNSNTIETLQNSGDIALIPSDIRNRLIDLKNFQSLIKSNSLANDLQKNHIAREVYSLFGNFDLEKRIAQQEELKAFLAIEQNQREIILGIENMQSWKNFSERRSISQLNKLLEEINIIEAEINKEIKK